MADVLITGGNGLIGKHLSGLLIKRGYRVSVLTRGEKNVSGLSFFHWDPEKKEIDIQALEIADFIVHLSGANLGEKRWTKRRKRELEDSRIETALLLHEKMKEIRKQPEAFISASAIGFYGSVSSEKIFHENDQCGTDFTGELCRKWENTAGRFEESGIRTVKVRTGIVLADRGGALSRIAALAKFGIAAALGSGNQYMPWIHIEDLCNIYIKAIEDTKMRGAYNAVAPMHCPNREFMKTVASALNRPFFMPNIPSFLIRSIFGEMSVILLEGSRVSCDKIINAGFTFRFPDLGSALNDLFFK